MFIIGFFVPIFWIIGALIPPTARAEGATSRREGEPLGDNPRQGEALDG